MTTKSFPGLPAGYVTNPRTREIRKFIGFLGSDEVSFLECNLTLEEDCGRIVPHIHSTVLIAKMDQKMADWIDESKPLADFGY